MSQGQILDLVKSELTCGDCRGLTRDALLPTAEKPCASQGIQEASKTCKHFRSDSPSLRELMTDNGDALVALFDFCGKLGDKDLRVMAGMMLSEARTRRHGVRMGQPVFIRYRGRETRNYLNNFMAARVLDVSDTEIRCISESGEMILTYPNTGFDGPSVYSKSAFKAIRRDMIDAGKLIDPEKAISTSKRFLPDEADVKFSAPSSLDGVSIPRMDKVVKGKGAKKKKKNKNTDTLVDLVSMIESGIDMGADVDESGQMELGENSYKRKVKVGKNGAVDLSDL